MSRKNFLPLFLAGSIFTAANAMNPQQMVQQVQQNYAIAGLKLRELEKTEKVVAKANLDLLLALKNTQKDPTAQINLMNNLTARANFEYFWISLARYGNIETVKSFWPDPSDKKIYLTSKESRDAIRKTKNGSNGFTAFATGELFSPDSICNACDVRIAKSTKTAATAFALGKTKDGSVRFVDKDSFSLHILAMALCNPDPAVFQYFSKQCGGISKDLQAKVLDNFLDLAFEQEQQRFQISVAIKIASEQKQKAEDKYDEEKIQQGIVNLETLARAIPPLDAAKGNWAILFKESSTAEAISAMSTPRMQQCLNKLVERREKSLNLRANAKRFAKMSSGSSGQFPSKEQLEGLAEFFHNDPNELSEHLKEFPPVIIPRCQAAIWDEIPHLGYVLTKNGPAWQKGIPYPGVPGKVSGASPDTWVAAQGYTKNAKGDFVWTPGLFSEEHQWQISGKKEGEWIPWPGYAKNAKGKISWQAGLPHPQYPNIVSGKRKMEWIPASGYQWKNPAQKNDYSTIPDIK